MPLTIQNILVPTDFSECSERALDYAVALGVKFGAQITLLHILHDLVTVFPEPGVSLPIPGNYVQEMHESAEQHLSRLVEKIPADVAGAAEIRYGTAFVEIIRFAQEKPFDLIAIGTHGRTGLAHVLLGSVAEKIVRKAPCPVLTVRPTNFEAQSS